MQVVIKDKKHVFNFFDPKYSIEYSIKQPW